MKGDQEKGKRFLVIGDYPVLEASLIREVKRVREHESLKPLLIFVSSKLLGLHLRRQLAEEGIPHLNLRFWTLEEFARERSSLPLSLLGKEELPPYGDELILGEIATSLADKDEAFYFREIADRLGFHRALLSTIKDLKDACLSPEDFERTLAGAKRSQKVHLSKLKDLLNLWKGYQKRLKEINCYDESDLMLSAVQWVKDSPDWQETPKVLIYGFYDFNEAQKRLLLACFEKKEAWVFLPFEPTPSFKYVKPAMEWLKEVGFQQMDSASPFPPPRSSSLDHLCRYLFDGRESFQGPPWGIEVVSAPGESREVREIIRKTLQAPKKDNISFHEIGILLRAPERYSRLFQESFNGIGIHPYLREGPSLIETRAGRTLILFLNMMHRNFSRQSVMEFATFAKLRTDRFSSGEGFPLTLARWDAISIQAGIREGQEEWEERLRKLYEQWLKLGRDEEEDEGRGRFHEEDAVALEQLIQFTRRLFSSVRLLAGATTWGEKVSALLNAFDDFVEQDEESLLVKEAVRRLSKMDMTGVSPSSGNFSRLVEEVLKGEVIPQGRFQRNGPAIVNLMAVRGVPFKMVIVPGLVEKSFPPLIRQDAILLDQERKVLNRSMSGKEGEPLPLKAEGRLDEERLLFRLTVGAATEKLILTFSRMEIGTGKERLPSSFLLSSIEALTGTRCDFNQIEQFPGAVRLPLSEIAVPIPTEAIDDLEYDLSMGRQAITAQKPESLLYLGEVSPFFEKGLRLEFSRWGRREFTDYEGMMASKEALQILQERYSIFKASISPTQLEVYAECPFQYLLKEIMGIEAVTEPEKEVTISPRDKGILVHDILWNFFTTLKKGSGTPLQLRPEDGQRLEEIAHKKFIEFEQLGLTGYPMLWEVEKRKMLEELKNFFSQELKETEFIPTYFEVRYGMQPFRGGESEISTEEPVPLRIGEKGMNLRGRIDRIDLTRDAKKGRVRDYKTGRILARSNDFQGGRTLQLPLYLLAAKQLLQPLHKGIDIESAEYYSIRDGTSVIFEKSQLDEKEGELQEILETLGKGIEEGIFIPVPDHQDCRYRNCDFRMICGSWSKMVFESKSKDPRVKRYLTLGEDEIEEREE